MSNKEIIESLDNIMNYIKGSFEQIGRENESLKNRIGKLEKQIMEPIAQDIVNNVHKNFTQPRYVSFQTALCEMRKGKIVGHKGQTRVFYIKDGVMLCKSGDQS